MQQITLTSKLENRGHYVPGMISGDKLYISGQLPVHHETGSPMADSIEQQTRDSHFHEMAAEYRKHFFNGCGQSFSCQAVCPAKLPLDEIQARANNYAARKL